MNEKIEKITNKFNNEILVLNNEIEHLNKELKTHEQNREALNRELDKMKNKYEIIENQNTNLQRKLENLRLEKEKPFVEILKYIDFFELINTLNEPDQIKEFLNSTLIHPDDDKPFFNKSFEEFWNSCTAIENNNIEVVKHLLVRDIRKEEFVEDWDSDLFTDIKYSLTARAFMINLLNEILRENMENI